MKGEYNFFLVFLSFAVAIFASYVSLELFKSVIRAQGKWTRFFWLAGGAMAMGFGIWSMHFIGMLAFDMPGMSMFYDIPLLALSIFIAIAASGFALYIVSLASIRLRYLILSGSALASAIAGMHYVGMYSMRMDAHLEWNYFLVPVSILIAFAASFAAFFIAIKLREKNNSLKLQIFASLLMGVAISGMHYTGMEAAIFLPLDHPFSVDSSDVLASSGLAIAVTGTTLLVLLVALFSSLVEKALLRQAQAAEKNAIFTVRPKRQASSKHGSWPI